MPPRHLRTVFERSTSSLAQTLPFRRTVAGIWVPTPLRALERGCEALGHLGLLGAGAAPGHLIDAGSGDGRFPAFLSHLEPTREIHGIELDPALCALARDNLEALGRKGSVDLDRVHLIEGDYCDPSTYSEGGIDPQAVHIFFNYPDGNQARLAQFVRGHAGRGTKLCILTHDRTLEIDELALEERHSVDVGDDKAWRLSIYGTDREQPRDAARPMGTARQSKTMKSAPQSTAAAAPRLPPRDV